MKAVVLILLSSLVLGLSACNTVANVVTSRFRVALEKDGEPLSALTLTQGESATITVLIRPLTGYDLSVAAAEVTLMGAPTGVSATPLTIPATLADGELTITALDSAPPIEDATIRVRVNKGGVGAEATFLLTIISAAP
jgi:hypothetical protein